MKRWLWWFSPVALMWAGQAIGQVHLPMSPENWRVVVSEGGQAQLRKVQGPAGPGMCVDWDFGPLPGSLRLYHDSPLTLPPHAYLGSDMAIEAGPAAQLSLWLDDAAGRSWMQHRPARFARRGWQRWDMPLDVWRDSQGRALETGRGQALRALHWRLATPQGGRGQWCLSGVTLQSRPAVKGPLPASALADTATALQHRMVDGKSDTLWVSSGVKQQTLSLDLADSRDISGLVVQWAPGMRATDYTVQSSIDGRAWQPLRSVQGGGGNTDRLRFGPLAARYLRLDLQAGPNWRYGIIDLEVQPASWAARREDWLQLMARSLPAGTLPAAITGTSVGWTVVGAPGALAPALLSDTGILEPLPGQFTLEPWLQLEGQWHSPSATAGQARALPVGAGADWQQGELALRTQVIPGADGHGRPWLQVVYQLNNTGNRAIKAGLGLVIQPFQVLPATRGEDLAGGVGGVYRLQVGAQRVMANDRLVLVPPEGVEASFASTMDAGLAAGLLGLPNWPDRQAVDDEQGLASGVLHHPVRLEPGQQQQFTAWVPLLPGQGMAALEAPARFQPSAAPPALVLPGDNGARLMPYWQAALSRIRAEQAGPWLRVDSRMALGAGNRDAMALADALVLSGETSPVVDWLLARVASGSTRRCSVLSHWASLAARIQSGAGWPEAALQSLQPWLKDGVQRLAAGGSCAAELSAEQREAAAQALLALVTMPPGNPAPHSGEVMPALGGALADGGTGHALPVEGQIDAGMGADPVLPLVGQVGPAAPASERRARWVAAWEALPSDHLLPGWQRWRGGREEGLRDARQAAAILQAIAAVLVAEEADHLRLLPGLPASEWGGELQIPGLGTAWGTLRLTASRQDRQWVLRLGSGLRLPPSGLVIDWPWKTRPGEATADGKTLEWRDGRLQLDHLPQELRLTLPDSVD